MNLGRRTNWVLAGRLGVIALLAASATVPTAAMGPGMLSASSGRAVRGGSHGIDLTEAEAEQVENSRDAGLLTDWQLLEKRFGGGHAADFDRQYSPERWFAKEAAKKAANQRAVGMSPSPKAQTYPLTFPQGTFELPAGLAGRKGVFYALSCTYLSSGGDWNVYLESGAEAVVFVDGRRVLTRAGSATGAPRVTIHAERGYHTVMVKFVAQSAPFRVALLRPNSGSRRKNNTPYLQPTPTTEDLLAALH